MEIVPENLDTAMRRAGVNQSELADRVGVTQPSIGRLLSGETKTSRVIVLIAEALQTTVDFLTGRSSEVAPPPALIGNDPEIDASVDVEILEIDLAYGMGGGIFVNDGAVRENTLTFSRSWLRNFSNAPPDYLFFCRGAGDSMTPTIHDNDIVLIDRSQNTVRMRDQIWAVTIGDFGMIKRLRPQADGTVLILSDNPNVPPDTASDGEMFIIGRVVAIVRKV